MFKALFVTLIAFTSPLLSDTALGEKLETQMWEDMKHRNFTAVENNIAPQFQSIHSFGSLTREAEIDLIKNLYLGSYDISNIKVTENGDTMVVTYLISVREKIEDKQLSSKPAPRLSVWKKINDKWQWIAHVNLKEVPQSIPKPASK